MTFLFFIFSLHKKNSGLLNTDKARVQSGSHLWRQALALFRQAERDVMEKANNTSGGVPTWRGWLDFNQRQSFSYSRLSPSIIGTPSLRACISNSTSWHNLSPLRFESSFDLFLFCYLQLSISMRLYNNNHILSTTIMALLARRSTFQTVMWNIDDFGPSFRCAVLLFF